MINFWQSLKCKFGYHDYVFYSDYDKELFHQRWSGTGSRTSVVGPLMECSHCDYHGSVELGRIDGQHFVSGDEDYKDKQG